MFLLVVLLLLTVIYLYYHMIHKRRGLPPGPTPLPFFGNSLSVVFNPPGEEVFAHWRRRYGKVFTFWQGNIPVVFISDYDILVETYLKDPDTYAGRPAFYEFEMLSRGGLTGLMLIDGEKWKEQRRFALKVFRDFGVNRSLMQDKVLDEISMLYDVCDKAIENGVEEQNLYAETEVGVGSLINSFLFGYPFHGEQKSEFFHLKKLLVDHFTSFGHPLVLMTMDSPHFYKRLPFFRHYMQLTRNSAIDLMNFFSNQVDEHKTNFDHDKEPSDYVHAFMQEWRRLDAAGEGHYFSRQQLLAMCYDLWVNGQVTTTASITWGYAFLIHNPHVQQKCQEELDRVVGMDRLVTMNDKPNLPYCTATVEEIYRVSNITPIILWHRTLEDVEIGGYKIKKDTLTMPQISAYFVEDEMFENAHKFDPDRFIDENGNYKRLEHVIPFGIGKRVCAAESLARTEVFLYITNILHRYKLSSGKQIPSLKRSTGATILIEPYLCRVEKRV